MAFKIKQEKIAPELENARGKLEEALQLIVERAEESPSTSDDEGNKFSEITIKKEPSPTYSPTKRLTQRTQRKRKRKDNNLNRNMNSYVMKLFDRAVDLTPFNEETPLYPICRAWINNQNLYKPVKEESKTGEDDASDKGEKSDDANVDDILQLPPPKPLPNDGRDLRIPSPVPQPFEPFSLCNDNPKLLSKELLLATHLQHWKQVRQKWKQAAKANEDRYNESGAILKAMFERSCEEDSSPAEPWNPLSA